jgi:glucose/arabinose dehydrogenase
MRISAGLAAVLVVAGQAVQAQSRASLPLPSLPQVYETADLKIRVEKVADGLVNPWSLAWLPNGDLLITERPGRLRVVRNGMLDAQPIAGVPTVRVTALGGLLDVLLHPNFARNQVLYLTYTKGGEGTSATTALARARLDGQSLRDVEEIFVAENWSNSPTNFGGRMVFGRDGKLYLAVGERQEQDRAQNTMLHGGKVLRLNDLPEIHSVGHRSPQGLAVHPATGELWENEHGPLGGDEINIVRAGANYGWPLVTFGKNYDGTPVSDATARDGFEPPLMFWVPSIAVSGMSFYTGERLAAWKGNAFVGSMMEGRTRATGHVQRITFAENGEAIQREPILGQLRQRIRDVRPGPDGLLYVLTDENPGVLLRIEPAE